MKHTITIRTNISEGAIERILGRVRARGWAVSFVYAQVDMSSKNYAISLIVEGDRSIENLVRQIEKLHDVEFASIPVTSNVEFIKKNRDKLLEFPTSNETQLEFSLGEAQSSKHAMNFALKNVSQLKIN